MKLLFDQNLSYRLVLKLGDIFPGASHVEAHGLGDASDRDIWQFAFDGDYCIVTKDDDFNDIAVLNGPPPKIIWLRIGNCTVAAAEEALRRNSVVIHDFLAHSDLAILEVQ